MYHQPVRRAGRRRLLRGDARRGDVLSHVHAVQCEQCGGGGAATAGWCWVVLGGAGWWCWVLGGAGWWCWVLGGAGWWLRLPPPPSQAAPASLIYHLLLCLPLVTVPPPPFSLRVPSTHPLLPCLTTQVVLAAYILGTVTMLMVKGDERMKVGAVRSGALWSMTRCDDALWCCAVTFCLRTSECSRFELQSRVTTETPVYSEPTEQ
jgi:hypothetical protein